MGYFPQRVRNRQIRVTGPVRCDRKTKHLIPRLKPGDIAVLAHEDLDEIAARGLIEARVTAVVNTKCSMTGRYPNQGPFLLFHAKIPLLDMEADNFGDFPNFFHFFQDGDRITIIDGYIYVEDRLIGQGVLFDEEEIERRMVQSKGNLSHELNRFIDNTLHYAIQEKNIFLGSFPAPKLTTILAGKPVLVVVRGRSYLEDLQAISHYIKEQKPVLIGVDGGADALLQFGFQPDLIIGDMDSVSDLALTCGAELLVHAYPDGTAPGQERVKQLGLHALTYAAPGTSEDIAMLVAHESGANLIVAVGTHTNMIDFLEKGRKGMASTLLTRFRIGSKLVDAKGVSQLYQTRFSNLWLLVLIMAAMIPVTVLVAVNPVVRNILRMIYWKLKLIFL